MLEPEGLDKATKWSAKTPIARYRNIEVRPVMIF
jgi:hypothetical protein